MQFEWVNVHDFWPKTTNFEQLEWVNVHDFWAKTTNFEQFQRVNVLDFWPKTLGQVCSCGSPTGPNLLLYLHGGPFQIIQEPYGSNLRALVPLTPATGAKSVLGLVRPFRDPWRWETTAVPATPPLFPG